VGYLSEEFDEVVTGGMNKAEFKKRLEKAIIPPFQIGQKVKPNRTIDLGGGVTIPTTSCLTVSELHFDGETWKLKFEELINEKSLSFVCFVSV